MRGRTAAPPSVMARSASEVCVLEAPVAVLDAEREEEIEAVDSEPLSRLAFRCTLHSTQAAREGKADTHGEALERLVARRVRVDDADAALRARVRVVEPHRLVHVLLENGHREDRDCGAVPRVAEGRVESVQGDVEVMRTDTRRGKRGLRRGVVALRDWGRVSIDGGGVFLTQNGAHS